MTYGHCGFTCESQCPPHHIAIQPPPFCITVPGPVLSCSDDSCAVACSAPCCGYGGCGSGGWGAKRHFRTKGPFALLNRERLRWVHVQPKVRSTP
ncbi:hypothetical protein lerEdw1_010644 [Lerista edwardsae]|nr:hypothetical protein lerEdw1_010644 [Lerista edwardsae]